MGTRLYAEWRLLREFGIFGPLTVLIIGISMVLTFLALIGVY